MANLVVPGTTNTADNVYLTSPGAGFMKHFTPYQAGLSD